MQKSIPTINHFVCSVQLENSFPDTLNYLKAIGDDFSKNLNLSIVNEIHHKFEPEGITLVYILSQSHLILHTWPEHNYIHFDLLSCSEVNKEKIEKLMSDLFPSGIKSVKEIKSF